MKTKICTKCKEEKTIDHFRYNKDYSKHDRLKHKTTRMCSECRRIGMIRLREYRKEHPDRKSIENKKYKAKYRQRGALYDSWAKELIYYDIPCRRSVVDETQLEVQCHLDYCEVWFVPTTMQVEARLYAIRGHGTGESNMYCGDDCKSCCSTFGKQKYRKGEEPKNQAEPRPDQAEFKKILIEERGMTCEKCGIVVAETKNLICHHILPVKYEPLLSLDKDNALLVCYECEQKCHSKPGCGYGEIAHLKMCDHDGIEITN